VDDFGIN
jgi:hypothetical protein